MSYEQTIDFVFEKIVVPFVLKSAEPLSEKLGQKVSGKLENLINTIESKIFPDISATLLRSVNIKKIPRDMIENKDVEKKIRDNPIFADNVERLIDEIPLDPLVIVQSNKIKSIDMIIGADVENVEWRSSDYY